MDETISTSIIPSSSSLLKYGNPYIVSKKDDKARKPEKLKHTFPVTAKAESAVSKETEELLDCILPPREWEEDGLLWRQKVSTDPATRLDVIKLGEMLDYRLQERQAREAGICPVRRELYTQCFDEIIRQVTINCSERGLMLLKIRDEIRMTLAAYQALYESSIAYGMRKAVMADLNKSENEELIVNLQTEKKNLQTEIDQLKLKIQYSQSRFDEIRSIDKKIHDEEMDRLKKANEQLKAQLKSIITPKKSSWLTKSNVLT